MGALFVALLLAAAPAAEYELVGRIEPRGPASITIHGATTSFTTSRLADASGRFRVRGLLPGAYTVAVFLPGRGETRETVEVGPGTADKRRRVSVTLRLDDSQMVRDPRRGTVSMRQLQIPESARREYREAQKRLERRDTAGAIERLERAVEIAPTFSEAWNNLGTLAYFRRDYAAAERYFRKALEEEPGAFEPLVNLGGVLVTVLKLDEALQFNLYAVLSRPNDALANSQLGLTYFYLHRFDLAEKYLAEAIRLDPAHFSHPQLVLAEIHLRRNERAKAAAALEDFLARHPDWHAAASMREKVAELRGAAPPR